MKTAGHHYEDKLLEFAYGELPANEAAAVDAHVRGCSRCAEAVTQIRAVRSAMSQLPPVPAPDAGLESLLAYAEQTARRNAEAKKQTVWWRRFLMPMASAAALLVVGVVAWRAAEDFNPDPGLMALELQKESAKAPASAPVVAPEAPKQAQKREAPGAELAAAAPERRKAGRGDGETAGANVEQDDVKTGALADEAGAFAGGYGASSAPLSQGKRDAKSKGQAKPTPQMKAILPADDSLVQDYSNAAQRGAYKTASPKPEPAPAKDVATRERASGPPAPEPSELSKNQRAPGTQAVWGLGTGKGGGATSPSGGQGVALGGALGSADPAPVTEAKPAPKKAKKEAAAESVREEAPRVQAPVAALAPPPPSAPSAAPAPVTKGSLGLKGLSGSSSDRAAFEEEDQKMAEVTDKLGLDRDAEFQQRRQTEARQQSLASARAASARGDRVTEVKLALAVLSSGATGSERVEALKRVCEGYEALGELDRAQAYCDTLVREFPTTAAAQAVAQRRSRREKAPAERANQEDVQENAPARPAAMPADTKPAEAY